MAIKKAAKRCTNYGWPVGPTLIDGAATPPHEGNNILDAANGIF